MRKWNINTRNIILLNKLYFTIIFFCSLTFYFFSTTFFILITILMTISIPKLSFFTEVPANLIIFIYSY